MYMMMACVVCQVSLNVWLLNTLGKCFGVVLFVQNALFAIFILQSKMNTYFMVCLILFLRFVTINDVNAGMSPAFFCKQCYYDFHFDCNNQPLYNFTVYPITRTDIFPGRSQAAIEF